jgi:hypothetical protein
MNGRTCGVVGIIMLVSWCASEARGVVFEDDFENQPLNSVPSGWTVTYNDYSPIRVGVSDAAAGQGSRSLFCDDYVPVPQIGLTASFPSQSEGLFLLTGMIRAEQTDRGIAVMRLRGPNDIIYNYLELGANGVFRYADGFANVIDSGVPYDAGHWYHLEFLIDMDLNQWDVAVANEAGKQVLSVENLRFITFEPSYFDEVNYVGSLYSGQNVKGQWYIDDIRLEKVPEPSTLVDLVSVLGVIGWIIALRRRSGRLV